MSSQNTTWIGPLRSEEVTKQIKTAMLGTHAYGNVDEALRAEALRVAVWSLNVLKQNPLRSGTIATTHRVLAYARAMWMPYFEASKELSAQQGEQETDEDAEEVALERDALDILEEQGDVFSLAGGYWLPAPLRLVHLTETFYLLVGGLPTHLLPQTILHSIRVHGGFRQVNVEVPFESLPPSVYVGAWQFQTLNNWLGPSPPSLAQLLQYFHKQELSPVIHQDTSNQPFEAYAASLDKPQALRWVSLENVRDGHFLLRTRTLWGMKLYSIGIVQNNHLVKQSSALHSTDIRRLCYALDHEAGTPTRVVWDRAHYRLVLRSELPARERKQMAAIGNLRVFQKDYYPREWIGIPSQSFHLVDDILNRLGVHLETDNKRY